MAINIVDIKTLPIVIGTIYTSPTNLDCVLLAVIRYMLYSYRGRLNISKLYYKAMLSLIRLSSTPELIKHLALLFPIYASTFKYCL